ncbi:hypothetical protein [Bacillus sp. Marseille-P3661]|uniref:hypothetical protein n=1 Tax=Bacillus sp. Marseille-P3661 TaxID=1936234 RepID=UPI000C84EFE4|nr:hypothetical protein [Bacillus sp. Marseille-P3661]
MTNYIGFQREGETIKVETKVPDLQNIMLFVDNQYIGNIAFVKQIIINLTHFPNASILTVHGTVSRNRNFYTISESYPLKNHSHSRELSSERPSYKAGDILIAADNVNGFPPGYMGHSAIVIDPENIIEVVSISPIVRKGTISSFTNYHPRHAQFRPKSAKMGEGAAEYAINYLNNFNHASQNPNEKVPIFNFSLSTALSDEWQYIYCSKLIWLSYYYGASYQFKNDHLWFAPEDLYTLLKDNPDFELVYIHPEFIFKIDL